jgi:transcription-repair coupling factor (superfamily II helicase)
MLYPSEEGVTKEAGARLASLADHTELGSGFRIAMRDLELRGAGDLLGAEQSGHVAAIGFELYVEMLDQAVAELRAAGGEERTEEEVRVDSDVYAYVPSDYVPYEAAKIDVHRRIAGARAPGELRALADELRDRFGAPPEPVEALLSVQRARIELGRDGARSLNLRGARIVAEPLDFDSERVARLREHIPEAIYSSRDGSLTLRVDSGADDSERMATLERLAEAVSASREPVPEPV